MAAKHLIEGEFCWNELRTNDTQAAKLFYQQLIGWEAHDIDMGEFTYTIFKKGGKDMAGMIPNPPEAQHVSPHWMAYVKVNDLGTKVKAIESLGGDLTVPVREIPGYGCFAVLKDASGAHLALWESSHS